jgi:hypothetical protein
MLTVVAFLEPRVHYFVHKGPPQEEESVAYRRVVDVEDSLQICRGKDKVVSVLFSTCHEGVRVGIIAARILKQVR